MNWIGIASVNLSLAVALGAFGAHGLKSVATLEQLGWWQTATQYFFFHAIGLLVIGILIKYFSYTQIPAYLLQFGVVIFTGSLYSMALGAPRWLGAVTPIGGILLIIGWLWLAFSSFKLK